MWPFKMKAKERNKNFPTRLRVYLVKERRPKASAGTRLRHCCSHPWTDVVLEFV